MTSRDALSEKLAALQSRIQQSPSTPDPSLYHQLGDVYAELGQRADALDAYGKALDGFLASGRAGVGVAICKKVIGRYPDVTRTYFTLACCQLAQGRTPEGVEALEAYVSATRIGNTTQRAIPRLRFMASLVPDEIIRHKISELLARVGDDQADRVGRGESAQATTLSNEKRTQLMLEIALSGADVVWQSYWLPT